MATNPQATDRRWRLHRCHRQCGVALIVLSALIFRAAPILAFERIYREPCEIAYKGDRPFVVTCVVSVGIDNQHVVMTARTPNGKAFIIENGGPDENEWFLDHKEAEVKGPDPCFQNAQVKVCF